MHMCVYACVYAYICHKYAHWTPRIDISSFLYLRETETSRSAAGLYRPSSKEQEVTKMESKIREIQQAGH